MDIPSNLFTDLRKHFTRSIELDHREYNIWCQTVSILHITSKADQFFLTAEMPLLVRYDGVELYVGYRRDLLVANSLIVELKSVEQFAPVHKEAGR